MFKRSLASVAAVAIASSAVVAPANAMTAKFNKDDMSCIVNLTPEEAKLTGLHASPKFEKGEAASNKANSIEPRLLNLRAQIQKDKEELAKSDLNEEQRKDLTSKLKKNNKELTAFENFRDALDACIAGKDYDSDKSSGTQKPEGQGKPNPEGQGKPGGTDQSGESKNPEDQVKPGGTEKPGDSQKPGGTEKPKAPSNPDVTPAPPSNDGAGIGVIFAGAIAAILGILAAALPIIKPMLPPQLRALLP
ncbi:hypothetical protein FRC0497_01978 [Corynebacterium diphtheriae]|nr:hypothetical protein FRC0497_01978 [Corynebacterium diphtheriae]